MNDQTSVLQLPATTTPALPKLSEVTKNFWIELLGLGGSSGNKSGGGNGNENVGGHPWK